MIFFKQLQLEELQHIIKRNVFLLTNGIIFSVVFLLFVFGQYRAGIFLGLISLANITAGLAQDIHAWINLERLQALTAPYVIRVNQDGSETAVLTEEIKKGDFLKLKIGDQVPCDCLLIDTLGLEISDALITGETNSHPKQKGDELLAGSIITSGVGRVQTKTVFHESRMARMTAGIKKHSLNQSPIQKAANRVVQYTGYALIIAIIYIIIRGVMIHQNIVDMILNIGTAASMLVPQGLVFTITLFFAYGSANLYRKHVLLQEINATEKLGRIKNLCMDKTGTLTENELVIENMYLPKGVLKEEAENIISAYIIGTADTSTVINSIRKYIKNSISSYSVLEAQPFSSWRQYGAVRIKKEAHDYGVFVGSPDIFLNKFINQEQQNFLIDLLKKHSQNQEHILCVVKTASEVLPKHSLALENLSVIAVFIFQNNIREGIIKSVNFFQKRGVQIRIITGDNPETAKAVANRAGILNTEHCITGQEMVNWSELDYQKKSSQYTIFARILPEQKEKIIIALKKNGFTAMVGDGANDALAIKKADLGIAMFDGAPATRRLAAIVLVNNSFNALPSGVVMADDIIKNIEIFSSVFFNQTFLGFVLFIILALFGQEYPLTPFNITLINYFTINLAGLLISFWTIHPINQAVPVGSKPFLKRVLPFALWSATAQAVLITIVYFINKYYFKITPPNTLIVSMFIILGFVFIAKAPSVYLGVLPRVKKIHIFILAILGISLFLLVFQIPFLLTFFNVVAFNLSLLELLVIVLSLVVFISIEYGLAKKFRVNI